MIILFLVSHMQTLHAFDGELRHYKVSLGPATLANLRVSMLAIDEGVHSVDVAVESSGLGDFFGSFKSTLEIMRLTDGTQFLSGVSSWNDAFSQIEVNWIPGEKAPIVDFYRSKPREYEITPIQPESIVNTVDPFRPVFDISRTLDIFGHCDGKKYRIFDGIRLYDLVITDGGKEGLADEAYEGSVHRCNITVKRLGGFSTERGLFKFDESQINRILYFGKVDDFWIPVRFEIESPLGTVIARLVAE